MKKIISLVTGILMSLTSLSATITVLNSNDLGAGSLREAITIATAGDNIVFDGSLAGSTIFLSSALTINKNLTIWGFPSASLITLDGGGSTRILSITSGNNVVVSWLNFTNGNTSSGGAILNSGTLDLSNCRLFNNQSTANSNSQGGGALYNNTNGSATLNNCEFYDNSVVFGTNNDAYGGAIFNRGSQLEINFCSFYNNSAGSLIFTGESRGGAIYNFASNILINSSTFSKNTCYGTAVLTYGGNIYNHAGSIDIKHSTIKSGKVTATFFANVEQGGNIWNGGTLLLENTIVAYGSTPNLSDGKDIYTFSGGTTTSLGYNIIRLLTASQVTLVAGDLSADPLLDTLKYTNNSFTKTAAILCGSPAYEAGNSLNAPNIDQADQQRIFGSSIDIGAFEIQNIPSYPNVTANSSASSICGGDQVTLTGIGALTYSWDNNVVNGIAFTPSSTTTYTVIGSNFIGCKDTATILVTVDPAPPVVANTTNNVICQGDAITLTGGGAISYSWDNSISNGVSFVPSSTNTYTVTGTSANGCSASASILITVDTPPTVTANSTNSTICQGDMITLTGAGANSYSWDNGAIDGNSFAPSLTTTYTVIGLTPGGCSNSASVLITVNALPTVTANATNTSICQGDAVTLTGSGAATYSWDNGVIDGSSFTPSSTTTYMVTGTNANGCQNNESVTITVNTIPNVTANTTNSTICQGDTITLTGSGAATYSWDNGVIDGTSFVPGSSTIYMVTGTSNGCNNTATILITVNSIPTVTASATSTTICQGDAITLSGNGATTYSWDNGAINGNSFSPSTTTNFTVTGTDMNGCSNNASIIITVNAIPTVTANATNTSICQGDTVTLTGGGASIYAWDNSIIDGSSFIPGSTTTYNVTGTDVNGCQNNTSVTITVNAIPTVTASATNTIICQGDAISLNGSGASTYSWDNGVIDGVSFSPSSTQIYNVIGTSAAGCQGSASITITVNPAPIITASAQNTVICEGDTTILNATMTPSGTYSWDNGLGAGQTHSISPAATTTYIVTGTETSTGCTNTASVIITVNLLPTTPVISMSGNDLTTGTYSTYQWYLDGNIISGATSQTITPSANGNYTVEVTNGTSCSTLSADFNLTNVGLNTLSNNEFQIYPNPTTSNLTIESEFYHNATIYSNLGQEIQSFELSIGKTSIDVSSLANGHYILRLSNDSKAETTTFIKK